MARGDHPMRTPFYGACLIVSAMLLGLLVKVWTSPPTWVQAVGLVVALGIALVGFVMTFRDLTPPPRR